MKYKLTHLFSLFIFIICVACHNTSNNQPQAREKSEYQEQLMRDGWTFETLSDSELAEEYGVKPVYGLQDNYFDIVIGEGCAVAIKIVNASTDRCIRYVYVPENGSVTISEIPQGLYYLKLAYGRDWMELKTDSLVYGRFTKGVFYERSTNTYDFGKKNSQDFVNFRLEINVVDGEAENNFHTEQISEEEFERN